MPLTDKNLTTPALSTSSGPLQFMKRTTIERILLIEIPRLGLGGGMKGSFVVLKILGGAIRSFPKRIRFEPSPFVCFIFLNLTYRPTMTGRVNAQYLCVCV